MREDKGRDKGRGLRGYFNFFDIALLLVALAAAAFIVLQGEPAPKDESVNNVAPEEPEMTTIRYVIELTGLEGDIHGIFNVGDEVYERSTGILMGNIEKVTVEDTTWLVNDYETGRAVREKVHGQSTVKLQIIMEVENRERAFVTEGLALRIGILYNLRFPQYFCGGYIISIERGDD